MASSPNEDTQPIDDSFLETAFINNRLYQQYAITNQSYLAPMDEDEISRLILENDVLNRLVFDGRLIFPPLSRPRRILDCGYGTANWAASVAAQFDRCEVVGIDVNPSMQTEEMPDNVYLQVDDLNRRLVPFISHYGRD